MHTYTYYDIHVHAYARANMHKIHVWIRGKRKKMTGCVYSFLVHSGCLLMRLHTHKHIYTYAHLHRITHECALHSDYTCLSIGTFHHTLSHRRRSEPIRQIFSAFFLRVARPCRRLRRVQHTVCALPLKRRAKIKLYYESSVAMEKNVSSSCASVCILRVSVIVRECVLGESYACVCVFACVCDGVCACVTHVYIYIYACVRACQFVCGTHGGPKEGFKILPSLGGLGESYDTCLVAKADPFVCAILQAWRRWKPMVFNVCFQIFKIDFSHRRFWVGIFMVDNSILSCNILVRRFVPDCK